jgi:magnesium-transporting ATPase (P-type)
MWSYQMFNILFAAHPICLYAILDRKASLNRLEDDFEDWKSSASKNFTSKVFWTWILEGAVQGLVVLSVCIFSICSTSGDKDFGKMDDMWVASEVIFAVIVVTVNLKVVFLCHVQFWVIICACFLCSLSYFVFAWVLTEVIPISLLFDNYDSRGSTFRMMINPNTYLAGVLSIVINFLLSPVLSQISKKDKRLVHHVRETSDDEKLQNRKTLEEFYVPHTGFAFSGEAGHVPQIVSPELFN